MVHAAVGATLGWLNSRFFWNSIHNSRFFLGPLLKGIMCLQERPEIMNTAVRMVKI